MSHYFHFGFFGSESSQQWNFLSKIEWGLTYTSTALHDKSDKLTESNLPEMISAHRKKSMPNSENGRELMKLLMIPIRAIITKLLLNKQQMVNL